MKFLFSLHLKIIEMSPVNLEEVKKTEVIKMPTFMDLLVRHNLENESTSNTNIVIKGFAQGLRRSKAAPDINTAAFKSFTVRIDDFILSLPVQKQMKTCQKVRYFEHL